MTATGSSVSNIVVISGGNYSLSAKLGDVVTLTATKAGYSCYVAGSPITLGATNITGADVSCTPNTYTVGGKNSLGASVTITGSSIPQGFTTSDPYSFSAKFNETVTLTASKTGYDCTVDGSPITVGTANITNANVVCIPKTYTIGGATDGAVVTATGSSVSNIVAISGGNYSLSAKLGDVVTLSATKAGYTCYVAGSPITLGAAPITGADVSCSPNTYTISGTNIPGTTVSIGASSIPGQPSITENSFNFKAYAGDAVALTATKIGYTCKVSGLPAVISGDVTVSVSCLLGDSVPARVTLSPSSLYLPSDGSASVTVTARVTNTDNNVMEGIPVSFKVDSGAITGVGVTDASGVATVQLTTGGVRTLRTIHVTATAGAVTGITDVEVVAAGDGNGVVSYINLVPSALKMPADGSKYVMVDAYVLDENHNLMQGVTVSFTASSGGLKGTVDAGTQSDTLGVATTDIYGKARTFLITAGDSSLRTITLTASAGVGASKITDTETVQVVVSSSSLGGSVSGLLAGQTVTLKNGTDTVEVSGNNSFTFSQLVHYDDTYAVTVSSQPTAETCYVVNGIATMLDVAVTSVQVVCTPNKFSTGGSIAGLGYNSVVTLTNNGGDDLSIEWWNNSFTFPTKIVSEGTYNVAVKTQPVGQLCFVVNGSGQINGSDVINVNVTCVDNSFTVGGTIAGMNYDGVVTLTNNSGDDLSIEGWRSSFTFGSEIADHSPYDVEIKTQPEGQFCTVANGSGETNGKNIDNVNITCTPKSYTVGGTVSGLSGSLVLNNNGGDPLTITSNGAYTFETSVKWYQRYAVTVGSQPVGQVCQVTNSTGYAVLNITNVNITCSDLVKMGKKDGSTFTAGTIGTDLTTISAGGITNLYVSLQRPDSTLYTEPVEIEFTSDCLSRSKAKLQDNVSLTDGKTVTTNTGFASVNYVATGCTGTDVITARATIAGALVSASVGLNVTTAQTGSITFITATPSSIALLGRATSTMPEVSLLRFRVKDANDNPIANQRVNFTLNTTLGGLKLIDSDPSCTDCATSGNDGYVQIYVEAGNAPTSVRVTATIQGTTISTQSSNLAVTTGLPDQDSFSLVLEGGINVEGYDKDGEENIVTARLSDRANNPVPDGTAVVFQTEGGSIGSQCKTVAGKCSVTWTSSDPRPSNGRVTILATAVGEDSFIDLNGNGIFDDTDTLVDIAEPFRDDNENGIFDSSNEPFYDFNTNLGRDTSDGQFNGACNSGLLCSATRNSAGIGQSAILIMSGSRANVTLSENPIDLTDHAVHTVNVDVFDGRYQVMPAGTSVVITYNNGLILSASSFTIGSMNVATNQLVEGATRFPIMIYEGGILGTTGSLTVTVTTPSGVVTTKSVVVKD